jgi:hypothetical protein
MAFRSTSRFVLVAASAVVLLSSASAPASTGSIKVLRILPFAEDAQVPQRVQDECDL